VYEGRCRECAVDGPAPSASWPTQPTSPTLSGDWCVTCSTRPAAVERRSASPAAHGQRRALPARTGCQRATCRVTRTVGCHLAGAPSTPPWESRARRPSAGSTARLTNERHLGARSLTVSRAFWSHDRCGQGRADPHPSRRSVAFRALLARQLLAICALVALLRWPQLLQPFGTIGAPPGRTDPTLADGPGRGGCASMARVDVCAHISARNGRTTSHTGPEARNVSACPPVGKISHRIPRTLAISAVDAANGSPSPT
jgi:hypothetical protein